ncbi:MAG TPA: organoarsenical effux MFS transporter ArsJ [Solirubrobacterales bacterium]|jgi:MFS family permease|nr:organoarsenical effux MFS transporter ArsJ [Solirubrobacterales bacterium]
MSERAGINGLDRRVDLRNYALVTGAYWTETLADGATRMLVLFYFYELGYSPFAIASLFIFYEIFGMVTNLVGGWLAARFGLRTTLFLGLGTQVLALAMLGFAPQEWLVVPYVMASQAMSGIAKDLTKMSSKSAVKLVVVEGDESSLYRWVAILTGSKNALKGVGFFLGGSMLTLAGFQASMLILAAAVLTVLLLTAWLMHGHLGSPDAGARFKHMFSNNRAVNVLAAARIFLFASRDVWFVVGLPVYLETVLGWSFWQTGGFLAIWVIGYGVVQAAAPGFVRRRGAGEGSEPDGRTATWLAFLLALLPAAIAAGLSADLDPTLAIVSGLVAFGVVFAMNSVVHSYLILAYSESDRTAMNVGFYYMANAGGRLAGTVLSGLLYEWNGLVACLWASAACVVVAGLLSILLPGKTHSPTQRGEGLALSS